MQIDKTFRSSPGAIFVYLISTVSASNHIGLFVHTQTIQDLLNTYCILHALYLAEVLLRPRYALYGGRPTTD
jgi:hypothetical protein